MNWIEEEGNTNEYNRNLRQLQSVARGPIGRRRNQTGARGACGKEKKAVGYWEIV